MGLQLSHWASLISSLRVERSIDHASSIALRIGIKSLRQPTT
jgi:hypothetical protein